MRRDDVPFDFLNAALIHIYKLYSNESPRAREVVIIYRERAQTLI